MPKLYLVLLSLAVIIITSYLILKLNASMVQPVRKSELETAINQAKHFYNQKKSLGEDISNGPCLSNALIPNWAADIVHSPRTKQDDLPENQCPAFLEGRAEHFVELDLEGNLVRAQ